MAPLCLKASAAVSCFYCECTQRSGVILCSYFNSHADEPAPVFLAKPSVVVFTDYSVGHVYEVCFRAFIIKRRRGKFFSSELVHCNKPLPCLFLSQTPLELKNVTSSSRHIRVVPPTTPYFSIGLGELLFGSDWLVRHSCAWCGEEIIKSLASVTASKRNATELWFSFFSFF